MLGLENAGKQKYLLRLAALTDVHTSTMILSFMMNPSNFLISHINYPKSTVPHQLSTESRTSPHSLGPCWISSCERAPCAEILYLKFGISATTAQQMVIRLAISSVHTISTPVHRSVHNKETATRIANP